MTTDSETQFTGSATYSPEDNKLRLYIGRVPREEYMKLKAEGWTTLHKQREAGGGDFAATWTPQRRDTALAYAGTIDDEDMGPEERAADRAERFGGYADKRADEAAGHADRFDAGPAVHGFQSYTRAVKSADRHDRIAGRAVDSWEKAEYWQRRTAGVIAHRLHLSSPAVRMGRIKEIEAAIRKSEKSRDEYENTRNLWLKCAGMTDVEAQDKFAARLAYVEHGDYTNPHSGRARYLYDFSIVDIDGEKRDREDITDGLTGAELCALYLARHGELAPEGPWLTHYRLRLSYELQMLEAQGGRAASVEMEAGGWLRGGRHLSGEERQIVKVNKSPATGRVVSVVVRDARPSRHNHWGNPFPDGVTKILEHVVKVERMAPDAYRAPTEDERAAFKATTDASKKAAAVAAKKKRDAGEGCPLVNPTDEDAERLQEVLNERAKDDHCARHLKAYGRDYAAEFKPSTVCRLPQAVYSSNSKGTFARAETRGLCANMELEPRESNMYSDHEEKAKVRRGPAICQIRTTGSDGSDYGARRVIVITDKPQKALPGAVWRPRVVAAPAAESVEDDGESVCVASAAVPASSPVVSVSAPVVVDSAPRVQLSLF